MGAGEIDPGNIRCVIKIRRVEKPRVGKIGTLQEQPARENGFAIEARVRERNV